MKKKIFYTAFALIPVYTAADLYRFIFCRTRSKLSTLLLDKKGHEDAYYEYRDSAKDAFGRRMHLCYTINSDRGEALQGYYFPCGSKFSRKIAFIVHGYHSEHAETAGMVSEMYRDLGFDIFTCDNTASGKSGGGLFGYDVFESADCLKWLDFLKKEFGKDIQVVLHGFSLGGAAVLKMSDRVPDFVKFIVSDSGFINACEILRSQLGPLYGIMDRINSLIAGYRLADTDVVPNITQAKAPVLVVHGKDDTTVPFSMAPRIYDACSSEKDFLFVDGARHIESMYRAPEKYKEKLCGFIDKYFE